MYAKCVAALRYLIAVSFFVVLFSVTVFARTSTGVVNDDGVNVRDAASLESNVLFTLLSGKRVTVHAKEGDFYRVSVDGEENVYINCNYIDIKEVNAIVEDDVINVRDVPSTSDSSSILGQLTAGELVTVTGMTGDWYEVNFFGEKAYVRQDLLHSDMLKYLKKVVVDAVYANPPSAQPVELPEEQTPTSSGPKPVYVTYSPDDEIYGVVNSSNGLNLREEPDQGSYILISLPNNAAFDIVETGTVWHKVNYDGMTGYMAAEFVAVKFGTKPVEDNSYLSMADAVIKYAKRFLGTPYTWGGTNLNRGVDCSGYVYSVFKHFGVSLTRGSAGMIGDGIRVEKKSHLVKGDLVFFGNGGSSNIQHVGIYIGDGQFIHSASVNKKGVIITNLSEDYYVKNYKGACRVI